jgi:predicted RNA-binding protein
MCEAAAFVLEDVFEWLVSECIDFLESEGSVTKITSMFGEKTQLEGRIKSFSPMGHKIIMEPR